MPGSGRDEGFGARCDISGWHPTASGRKCSRLDSGDRFGSKAAATAMGSKGLEVGLRNVKSGDEKRATATDNRLLATHPTKTVTIVRSEGRLMKRLSAEKRVVDG